MSVVQRAWSEAETTLATELWLKGLTAVEIAQQLGTNRSRNAVIGIIHRLGIQRSNATPARRVIIPRTRKVARASKPSPPRPTTTWKATPPKPSAKSVKVDPTSPASLMAAAIIANARAAEARREVYRGRSL